MSNKNFYDLSPKIKASFLGKLNDYYCTEKKHTVLIIPFFGLLHPISNEPRPILNHVDLNILNIMKNQFKDVIVYPGDNKYISVYNLSINEEIENFAKQQYYLSSIVNRPTSFSNDSKWYENIKDNLDSEIVLPYSTAFDIENIDQLISYVRNFCIEASKTDKLTKICLICPLSYISEMNNENYNKIKNCISSINGTLYFAQNQADTYMYNNGQFYLYDERYEEKFINSIQDFAKTYSAKVSKEAKKVLKADELCELILNGQFGNSENEIIERIEQIDVDRLYESANLTIDKQIKKRK